MNEIRRWLWHCDKQKIVPLVLPLLTSTGEMHLVWEQRRLSVSSDHRSKLTRRHIKARKSEWQKWVDQKMGL